MTRKNPENKPLKIVRQNITSADEFIVYINTLSTILVAQSNLVIAGKDSAMPHFIAIVKELESVLGFRFEIMEE